MFIKFLTNGQFMQASLAMLLALTLLLRCLLSTTATLNLPHLSLHPAAVLAAAWCAALSAFFVLSRRRRPVLLLDYSCYQPPPERKCSYEVCEYLVRRSARFTTVSEEFMRGIYLKSGLGDETYAPPFIFQTDYEAKLRSAVQEAEDGMFTSTANVLEKAHVDPSMIDIVIVSCGMFTPCPSLSAILVNRFKFRQDVQTFNLSGMGCSSGIASIDLAARLLRRDRSVRYALVVVTESISLNWYTLVL